MPDSVGVYFAIDCSPLSLDASQIMIGNGMSDWMLNWRYWIQGNCYDNPIFNRTGCDLAVDYVNKCLDLSQLAFEEPSLENRVRADEVCMDIYVHVPPVGSTGRNPYHATQKCDFYDRSTCFPEMDWLNEVANSSALRKVVSGVFVCAVRVMRVLTRTRRLRLACPRTTSSSSRRLRTSTNRSTLMATCVSCGAETKRRLTPP